MNRLLLLALVGIVGLLTLTGIAAAGNQSSTTSIRLGAHTSFDRTYNWVVTKSDDQHSAVTVAQNAPLSITYTISVANGTPLFTDSNWVVQDGIVVDGTAPFTINDLSNVTAQAAQGSVVTNASVTMCSVDSVFAQLASFPFTGTHLLCHYIASLPSGSDGTVSSTVTLSDTSQVSGSTPFSFTTDLSSGQPVIFGGTVNVVDSLKGLLGSVAAPVDSLHPQTFTYSVPVSTATCGTHDLPNTVNLTDARTGRTVGTASDTVRVTVTCPPPPASCTFTQGYWKTHSVYGPAANPDATWNLIKPSGPDSPFFLSGQTWLQVFNTSPAGGNVYYSLAHQYEAAVLNGLGGASSTAAVNAAMADASAFFKTYTPAQAGALGKSSAARLTALADSTTLDDYNSGLIGPGHCNS